MFGLPAQDKQIQELIKQTNDLIFGNIKGNERSMKDIELSVERQEDGSIIADVKKWPGSPPVGRGSSVREALGDWLIYNSCEFDIKIKLSEELWKECVAQHEKSR